MFEAKPIEIGKEYGWLTPIRETRKDEKCVHWYLVRCRCGKEYEVRKALLLRDKCKCLECALKHYGESRREVNHEGKIINDFQVLRKLYKTPQRVWMYECKCLKCGSLLVRSPNQLKLRRGQGCEYCYHKPNFNFEIKDGVAKGTLPTGEEFLIDEDLVDAVSQDCWKTDKKGYICREVAGKNKIKLHWLALGYTKNPGVIVDHINRNKKDNRRCNLRVVTPAQNSMNHSKISTNKSGYTGVFWNKQRSLWHSFIYVNGRHINFGDFKDKVVAAQYYNAAALLLRGDYAGELNDVPPANPQIEYEVYEKCVPYIQDAVIKQIPIGKTEVAKQGGLF